MTIADAIIAPEIRGSFGRRHDIISRDSKICRRRMKGTPEELDDILSKYESDSPEYAIVVMLFEILKELKRLRMSQ